MSKTRTTQNVQNLYDHCRRLFQYALTTNTVSVQFETAAYSYQKTSSQVAVNSQLNSYSVVLKRRVQPHTDANPQRKNVKDVYTENRTRNLSAVLTARSLTFLYSI